MDSDIRKDHLIHAAIDILDELGYQGLTIKELSTREHISDAAIYKHFKNKNEIIIDVLDYYNNFFVKIYESDEINRMSVLDAIEEYISKFLAFYEEHPAMTAIINCFETLRHDKEISDSVSKILNGRFSFLMGLFQKGIDHNEFNRPISAESLAHIMVGTVTSVSLCWRMKNYSFSLTDKIQSITKEMKSLIL